MGDVPLPVQEDEFSEPNRKPECCGKLAQALEKGFGLGEGPNPPRGRHILAVKDRGFLGGFTHACPQTHVYRSNAG